MNHRNTLPMGTKILIVDDDKTCRKLAAHALKDFVCDIFEASDGVEGLALAQHEHPDVILLDFNMPVMDGFRTLAKIRADRELRSVPVIMITSETARDRVVRVAQLGVSGYLVKPFKGADVAERVGRVVNLERKAGVGQATRRFDDALQILVVDDKPAILKQIQEALAGTRWSVQGVAQPVEAVTFCTQTPPDLVLISLSLPEGAAFSLFQALREVQTMRTTPILALSVKTAADEQARAQQLGFAGVVTKPIDFEALLFKVTRALNLDTSAKYFQLSDSVLKLVLPTQFNPAVAGEISARLRSKICEAVDAGLNRFVIDMSEVTAVDATLIKLGLQVSHLCAELEMRCGFVGSEDVQRECKNNAEAKDWQFSGSVEEALTILDAKTPTVA